MLAIYLESLLVMMSLGLLTWLLSLVIKDVSIVDSLWSLMFFFAGIYVFSSSIDTTGLNWVVMILLGVWAIRLSVFLTVRNWGEPEDRRYQQIRANNSPNFEFKSLFVVFWLQAFIAWVVFSGLLPGLYEAKALHWLDVVAILIWLSGFLFETVADWQLYSFRKKAKPGEVLSTGLWRYSRHPNYFGESLIWWAFFLMTITQGYWWVIVAPVVMTLLLLKVSGVGLMEQGITSRRPAYQDYIDRTSAFIPWFPKKRDVEMVGGHSS